MGVWRDEAGGVSVGVSVSVADCVGEPLCRFFADGVSDSSGVGLGNFLFRCFVEMEGLGSGVSDAFDRGEVFAFGFADRAVSSSGVAVGDAFLECFGDADGLGSGASDFFGRGESLVLGLPDGLGDGVESFFFVGVFLRLCGAGVGVGAKTFLILSPNDSSADSAARAKVQTTPSV